MAPPLCRDEMCPSTTEVSLLYLRFPPWWVGVFDLWIEKQTKRKERDMKENRIKDVREKLKQELPETKKAGQYAAAVMDSCVKALVI